MSGQDEHGPDFAKGVAFDTIPEGGVLAGTVGEDPVILTRRGDVVRAFGGTCTHLGAPLGDGLVVDGAVRCPWHHACFDLDTGKATAAPAFDPLPRWTVERRGSTVVVTGKAAQPARPAAKSTVTGPAIVIVGGGAGAYAAAHELHAQGFTGTITMVSAENHPPYDRTLLTKDYLDGKFGDDHLPIAKASLDDLGVTFIGGVPVTTINPSEHRVTLADGRTLSYDKLLLATGAEPNRLDVPGADHAHVVTLRSLDDCRSLLARLKTAKHVVVVGSSFIGLEAAASIRSKGFDVTVVTPDSEPMVDKIGPELSRAILDVHKKKGVVFRLKSKVKAIEESVLKLDDGSSLPADLVVVGIGVKPRTALAEAAGLAVDDGVVVDATLRTSDPDIFAVGDIARWPDPTNGTHIRVEHWVVAERQGQIAARNMMGGSHAYDAVPFFWSKHFDFSFRYIGHADRWSAIDLDGSLGDRKAVVRFREGNKVLAVATVGDDLTALKIERDMERGQVRAAIPPSAISNA